MSGPKDEISTSAIQRGYFDLRSLGAYSSTSIRWLRDRLIDRTHPLPHHRVGGKLLVKREDFDQWIARYRQERPVDELDDVVNSVLVKMGK